MTRTSTGCSPVLPSWPDDRLAADGHLHRGPVSKVWDVVVVGAGPAGSTAALSALRACPDASVLLLDRADFPRDKACGDGIAPHVLDVLDRLGVSGLLDDQPPVSRLKLRDGSVEASQMMRRPAYVVPRQVFDARLVDQAVNAGAVLRRHRVRSLVVGPDHVLLDSDIRARIVVGADGAHSFVREAVGLPAVRRRALALRGYAPTRPELAGQQVIIFGETRQPSYAWSFDRGDGWANVGYGELLAPGRRRRGGAPGEAAPSRELLLRQLDALLPSAGEGGRQWRAHHLPLSSWRLRQPDGPVLLVGDAAGLINPLTGEGIYYAVATGALAGQAAVNWIRNDDVRGTHGAATTRRRPSAGACHRRAMRGLLGRHLRHTAGLTRITTAPRVLPSSLRAANRKVGVFDDLVEIGLGQGLLSWPTVRSVSAELLRRPAAAPGERSSDPPQP